MELSDKYGLGFTGKVVEAFLVSKLPVLFIIGSLLAGIAALEYRTSPKALFTR